MSVIRLLFQCVFSPRLYKIYDASSFDKLYEPRNLERWGDQILTSFYVVWSLGVYAVPFAATFMYRRSSPLADSVCLLTKVAAGVGALLVTSLFVRGYSRATNPSYMKFVRTFQKAKGRYDSETKLELSKYDFEFWAWPVDYRISDSKRGEAKLQKDDNVGGRNSRRGGHELILALPCRVVSYILAHTFAIKLMYPGSISLLNYAMGSTLLQGRVDLVKKGGERSKLVTADGNEIDTMFMDQRNKSTNGHILVVSCEGNCGFYEIGIVGTPLSKGYSVLGWNHPGFGGSTGTPYPSQERNGIDCVMSFAINRLGFKENQIILYGWSIGGYTSTWAAMNYPSVMSVILDASFDDVLPLAIARMPSFVEGLVKTTVREHLNLNVAEQLVKYHGPVLLIRRTEDEMVCVVTEHTTENVDETNVRWNRGNQLLTKLLSRRYPKVLRGLEEHTLLKKFLGIPSSLGRRTMLDQVGVDDERCSSLVSDNVAQHDGKVDYPSDLGENFELPERLRLALFLATKYMKDQHTQHCTPLMRELFHPGWDPASTLKSN